MSETNFTKGPWFVSKQGYFVRYHIPGFANCNICDVDCGAPLEEREANARLIAAAPELYEACTKALERGCLCSNSAPGTGKTEWHSKYCVVPALRSALAKVSVPRPTTEKAGA